MKQNSYEGISNMLNVWMWRYEKEKREKKKNGEGVTTKVLKKINK